MKKRLILCLVLVCLFIFYHFFQYGVLGKIECYIDDKKIDSYYKIIETDAKLIFGGLAGVPGGFLLASIPDLVGGSLKSFANKLEKKNKGYGTIIAANWIVVGSNIKSQTKNTK